MGRSLPERTLETDVLVVGSEGAGARAAIEASRCGVRAMIATKGRMAKSGVTFMAAADITLDSRSACEMGLPGDEGDSREKFFRDVVVQGFYLSNQKLVEAYVRDAPARAKELIDWGMAYGFDGEREILTSGIQIVYALKREAERRGVDVVEDVMITEILTDDGRVVGALGIDIPSGEFLLFKAKAVVLATGGWHKAYSFTTGSEGLTGDGQAMAYRAGAELLNMEMVTFCPNIVLDPQVHRGNIFLYNFASFTRLGHYLDNRGEHFLREYDPRVYRLAAETEWNKLLVSLAEARVARDGRAGPHGGVYYSLKALPWNMVENARQKLRETYIMESVSTGWRWHGVDFSEMMKSLRDGYAVEVGPAAHYFEGGVSINENCETTVPGLYAAGECAGGLFGANRVSSAITEILFEGAIAGSSAAEYAKRVAVQEVDAEKVKALTGKGLQPLKREKGVKPVELRRRIRKIADECMWVIRDGEKLKEAVKELEGMVREELPRMYVEAKHRHYNKEWIEALQIENLVTVLLAAARSALMREESRGVHYRSDYPEVDNDDWLKEIVVKQVDGEMLMSTRPVAVTTLEPPRGRMTLEESMARAIEALEA